MNLVDDRILELIHEEGPKSQAMVVDDDRVDWNIQYVGRRIRTLAEAGLLIEVGNGVYQITEDGEEYLEGELDARDLPEPDK